MARTSCSSSGFLSPAASEQRPGLPHSTGIGGKGGDEGGIRGEGESGGGLGEGNAGVGCEGLGGGGGGGGGGEGEAEGGGGGLGEGGVVDPFFLP